MCPFCNLVSQNMFVSYLECPASGVFPSAASIMWPVCRPSVKCTENIPLPPFYTGLFR